MIISMISQPGRSHLNYSGERDGNKLYGGEKILTTG